MARGHCRSAVIRPLSEAEQRLDLSPQAPSRGYPTDRLFPKNVPAHRTNGYASGGIQGNAGAIRPDAVDPRQAAARPRYWKRRPALLKPTHELPHRLERARHPSSWLSAKLRKQQEQSWVRRAIRCYEPVHNRIVSRPPHSRRLLRMAVVRQIAAEPAAQLIEVARFWSGVRGCQSSWVADGRRVPGCRA